MTTIQIKIIPGKSPGMYYNKPHYENGILMGIITSIKVNPDMKTMTAELTEE